MNYLQSFQALHERLTAEEARRHELDQKRGTAVSQRDLAIQPASASSAT